MTRGGYAMRGGMMLGLLAVVLWGGCGGGGGTNPTPNPPGAPNEDSPLGTNLDWGYWLSEFPFKDIFKQSMPWLIAATGQPAPLTADGWPQTDQPVLTSMYLGVDGHYPKGQYTCLYDGEGTLEFSEGATAVSQTPGKIVLDVSTDKEIWLQLSAMNPTNPVRNLRVVMPGFESDYLTQPFHPMFLERLKRYKVIRFGGWQASVGGSTLQNWADRPRPNHCTQAGRDGVALEHTIQLANALNADPWYNLPHLATDDFVVHFAAMVRDQLKPNLKVYIEYSNEVWNDSPFFPQSQYANTRGMELNLAAEYPSSTPEEMEQKVLVAGRRFYSQRSVEIFNLWQQVFGSTQRLVRVLATHTERPELGAMILDWQNAYQHADALAVGPYFGFTMGIDQPAPPNVDGIFNALPAHIAVTLSYVVQNRDVAAARGLPIVAYEGGQHLTVNAAGPVTDRFIAANRDPRMKTMYKQLLDGWRASGGRLFLHLEAGGQYGPNGSWGALEWYDQTHAPKHDALMEFIDQNPRWWP